MQVWVHFQPGVGGDGIVNLIEQSKSVVPLDYDVPQWRVHRYVDGELKFWAPTIDRRHCFRYGFPFKNFNNSLNQRYKDLVTSDQNIVIASHDVLFENLNRSDELQILKRNRVDILITTHDPEKTVLTNLKKTLNPLTQEQLAWSCDWQVQRYHKINHKNFDLVFYAEEIRKSFTPLEKLCQSLFWQLDQKHYNYYIDLTLGKIKKPSIEHFVSYVDELNLLRYCKVTDN